LKDIYSPEEEKLLKYIAWHTLYVYSDPRGFSDLFKYRAEPEKVEEK